jgi:hypothetical protein
MNAQQKKLADDLEPLLDEATDSGMWLCHVPSKLWYSVYEMREMIRLQCMPAWPAQEYRLANVVEHVDELEARLMVSRCEYHAWARMFNEFMLRVIGDPNSPVEIGTGEVSMEEVVRQIRGNSNG